MTIRFRVYAAYAAVGLTLTAAFVTLHAIISSPGLVRLGSLVAAGIVAAIAVRSPFLHCGLCNGWYVREPYHWIFPPLACPTCGLAPGAPTTNVRALEDLLQARFRSEAVLDWAVDPESDVNRVTRAARGAPPDLRALQVLRGEQLVLLRDEMACSTLHPTHRDRWLQRFDRALEELSQVSRGAT